MDNHLRDLTTKEKMIFCLDKMEEGLTYQEISTLFGFSTAYTGYLFQEMDKYPDLIKRKKEIKEELKLKKMVACYVAKQKKRYIKNLQTYFRLLPLYTYIKENHATWQMAEEHFKLGHGKIQSDIKKLKSVSPSSFLVLKQIAEENIHNTHRIENKKVDGLPNEMNWIDRSMLHIDYIIEHQCSILDATSCIGASPTQIGNDIYRMMDFENEEMSEKAKKAYQILLEQMGGTCSYVDYRGKCLSRQVR